jgi:HD-GYP domain-containing protein (c-di-GMP phosphodiesterase class II)
MPSNQLEDLRMAAFLHDVGHMTLSAEGHSLEAPGHAEEGEKIVAGANFPLDVVDAVSHHHDRWDGAGLAQELSGESLPFMARILAVAERFEATTAGRGCPRLTLEEALAEVVAQSGSEFDPDVVDALGRAVGDKGLQLDFPSVALPATATA